MRDSAQRVFLAFCLTEFSHVADDVYCPDTPIQDDPQLNDYNVPQVVEAFVQVWRARARVLWPTSTHILHVSYALRRAGSICSSRELPTLRHTNDNGF